MRTAFECGTLCVVNKIVFRVEADPKTVRKCGDPIDKPDEDGECAENLRGNNKIIVRVKEF